MALSPIISLPSFDFPNILILSSSIRPLHATNTNIFVVNDKRFVEQQSRLCAICIRRNYETSVSEHKMHFFNLEGLFCSRI